MTRNVDLRTLSRDKRPPPTSGQSAPPRYLLQEDFTVHQRTLFQAAKAIAEKNEGRVFTIGECEARLERSGWKWRDVSNVLRGLVRTGWILRTQVNGVYEIGKGLSKPSPKKRPRPKAAIPVTEKEQLFMAAYAKHGPKGAAIEKETGLAHGFVQRRLRKEKEKKEAVR